MNALATGDQIQLDDDFPVAEGSIDIKSDELLDTAIVGRYWYTESISAEEYDTITDDDVTKQLKLSAFQQECIHYITGFAVRKMLQHITCPNYENELKDAGNENNSKLLGIKNRGYSTVPSTTHQNTTSCVSFHICISHLIIIFY